MMINDDFVRVIFSTTPGIVCVHEQGDCRMLYGYRYMRNSNLHLFATR